MGFDLSGKSGNYFRNNCWWWRMLWRYTCDVCGLSAEALDKGNYNDGYEIDQATADRIASILTIEIEGGATKKFEQAYAQALQELPDIECDLCKGSGERHDKIVDGQCNKCGGKGKVRPWQTHYPFNEDNVREFRNFVKASQGFAIY